MSVTVYTVEHYQDAAGKVRKHTRPVLSAFLTPEQIEAARNQGFIVKPARA